MSSRKVASVLGRLFRGRGAAGPARDEPSPRRLLRTAVAPDPPFAPQPASGEASNKSVRSKRLMKELSEIERSQRKSCGCRGHHSGNRRPPSCRVPFTVELVDDNLFEWRVRLYAIDPDSDLYRDMLQHDVPCILLQMSFPENFPFCPPFMRVVTPRIEKGFVMEGGAICMELLTPRGWASAYTVEAVVMQFAASLVKGQGRISKKTKSSSKDFSKRLAEESFRSLVKTHEKYGWVTPPLADG